MTGVDPNTVTGAGYAYVEGEIYIYIESPRGMMSYQLCFTGAPGNPTWTFVKEAE